MINRRSFCTSMLVCSQIAPLSAAAQDDGLIDIDSLKAPNTGPLGVNINVNEYPVSVASGMAYNCHSAILSLIGIGSSKSKQYYDLNEIFKKAKYGYDRAVADKEHKLSEYRAGQFCSGCKQTKSEILAKGEQFPHPGRTIIPPTPQQIAEFEAKLDKIILDFKLKMDTSQKPLKDLKEHAYSAFAQIKEGIDLWRTASNFARKIAVYNDMLFAEAYFDARQNIAAQINDLSSQLMKTITFSEGAPLLSKAIALSKLNLQFLRQESQTWIKTRDSIIQIVKKCDSQDQAMEQLANQSASGIKDFSLSNEMKFVATLLVGGGEEITLGALGFHIPKRGHYFLMGQLDIPAANRQLPKVIQFLSKIDDVNLRSNKNTTYNDNNIFDPHELTINEMTEHLKSLPT